jgi:hypothetical protein
MEAGQKSVRNRLSTTTGFTHSGNDLEVLDVILDDLCSIKPAFVVHPLSQQFESRLRTEVISPNHVEVINESDNLGFSHLWLVLILGFSLEVTFNNLLDSIGGSTGREVDGEAGSKMIKSR